MFVRAQKQFNPLNMPRNVVPVNGKLKITVLDSFGLHFGEEKLDELSQDQIAWQDTRFSNTFS